MFKFFRVFILATILILIAVNAWLTHLRSTDWDGPLSVVVYPIAADNRNHKIQRYLNSLTTTYFNPLEVFLTQQAKQYGLRLNHPAYFSVADPLKELPPLLSERAGTVSIILWSLQFRYWVWRMKRTSGNAGADVHLFVIYHDPAKVAVLRHSIGLQKGMAGIVNAYGDHRYRGSNAVVMIHELLHTLGATDKYDLLTGQLLYPLGFAEPDKKPLYPQRFAEVMGGKIPVSETENRMPRKLGQVMIGRETAAEIQWINDRQ